MEQTLERIILDRIRPSDAESKIIEGAASEVVRRVSLEAQAYFASAGGPITPVVVGSVAKGTYLKEADADVFMTFPVEASREFLERTGLEIGRKVLEHPVLKYAEHPYMRGVVSGVNIDLVPCYAVKDPSMKMSAVDRTPFQTDYVNSHMSRQQRDEVRLLKRFFKGTGVYGAEARVNGFSGYLTELLVLRYGTFNAAVEAISKWKRGTLVTLEGAPPGPKLSSSDAFLILPDPVDTDRNVAAAVGSDAFSVSVMACRRYLRTPGKSFFFPESRRPASLSSIRKAVKASGHGLLLLKMLKPDVVDDNLYPQIQKARRNILSLLHKHEFAVNRSVFSVDSHINLLFELRERVYSRHWLREGPAGWSENSLAFIEKHAAAGGTITLVDGKLYSEEARPFADPEELLEENVKSLSMGADVDGMKGTITISADVEVISSENRELLTMLLFPRFPWE